MSLALTEKFWPRLSSPFCWTREKLNDRVHKGLTLEPTLSQRIQFTHTSSLGREALSVLLLSYISLRYRVFWWKLATFQRTLLPLSSVALGSTKLRGVTSQNTSWTMGNVLQDPHGEFICPKRRRNNLIKWEGSSWSTAVRLTSRAKVKCIRTGCWVKPVSRSSYQPHHP